MSSTTPHRIVYQPSNAVFSAAPDETLLAAAERAGVAMPNSCRNGTCRTCLCRAVAGTARHLIAWPGLSADEKREGYLLPCVAVAESALVLAAP